MPPASYRLLCYRVILLSCYLVILLSFEGGKGRCQRDDQGSGDVCRGQRLGHWCYLVRGVRGGVVWWRLGGWVRGGGLEDLGGGMGVGARGWGAGVIW